MVRTVHFNKSNNNDDDDDDDDDDAPSRGRTRSRRHDLHDQNIMFEGVVDGTTHHLNGEDEGLGVDGGSGVVGEESSFNRSDIVVAGKRRRSITPHPNHHRHRHVHQHQKKKTTTAMIRRHNHHHGRTESSGDENEDEGKHYQYDVMMDEEVDIENSDIYESVDEDQAEQANDEDLDVSDGIEYGMETFGEGDDEIESMEGEGEGADENAEEQHGEKEHSEAIVVDDNRAHNQKWEKFTAKMEVSAETPPNLAVYLKTKQIRCDTIEKMLLALETAVNEMKAVTTELTDETLVSTHERQQAEVVSMENNVTVSFYNNDKRRKDLLKKMNVANKKWEKLYTNMARRVLNAIPEHENEDAEVCEEVRVVPFDPSQPDWDTLAEYEPSRDNIETFVEVLEKRREATGDLEEIYHKIKSDIENVVNGVIHVVNETQYQVQHGMDELEIELESKIMNNHKGRCDMQKLLLESELRAQERFLKLRSRLAGQ